jgi:pimeloyl-ACP methyl ester carboxylesterase
MSLRSDAGLPRMNITVPGATLHYEVRGTGPLLVIVGSPMAAAEFAAIADAMADDRTVVTLDPRGYGDSPLDDADSPSTPEIRADDVVAVLDAVGADTADVFGSSGGAVTGLALVATHPGRVRTLVAHEPPLLELLPDAASQRAATDAVTATFHRDGPGAAWGAFMVNAGFDPNDGPPPGPEPTPDEMARQLAESARFFDHDLPSTTRYAPDAEALRTSSTRVVVGLGETSGTLLTDATSRAAAALLGTEPVMFPGGHGGFMEAPAAFAERLRAVLATQPISTA